MKEKIKFFTIEEANELVPWLNYQFGLISLLIRESEEIICQILSSGIPPSPSIFKLKKSDSGEIRRLKKQLQTKMAEIMNVYSQIKEKGVIIEDISTGTVSFYSSFGEHPAFLSWQFGDNEVKWWHEIFEGVENKKPIHRRNTISSISN